MLRINVAPYEYYDTTTEEKILMPGVELRLEHSLASISKWESFYEKPFLTNDHKTEDEILYYTKCMSLDDNVPNRVFRRLTTEDITKVSEYISKKHTATWFSENSSDKPGAASGVVTSEVIYYWMVSLNIPFECENWNLNRLLTLVRVINAKNQPAKKMTRAEAAARARQLNKQRQKELNTTG